MLKGWRHAAVWLHIITSVGWMAEALTLFALMLIGSGGDPGRRASALSMAHVIDLHLLAPLANASAFTGFLLAAATPWGFFRHWWVFGKFTITVVQFNVAIIVLSPALAAAERAALAGEPAPWPLAGGTALMASAIAFQAWLSVAKPWKRTPWAGPGKPKTGPVWVFAAAVCAPIADAGIGIALGFPLPLLSLIALVVRLVSRSRGARGRAVAVG
ncbi:hypothetical protein [Amycolatopsis thermophila]|uniref:Uncharacterized protein n=1 Tax=Amycolatopsis thermophila TaxID=206084 RepID=A0ABU0ENZ5_9PSEU|nr:hypothetical protein [Amycolatopsis thermophila]MDQ0376763.1 hypothetical protein [Amycolatopsis thermophila]